jgi:hypothetical protein
MQFNERRDRLRVRRNHPFALDLSCPIDDADRSQFQRHVQSDIVLHCLSPSLQGSQVGLIDPWRADSQSLSVALARNYPMCENTGLLL